MKMRGMGFAVVGILLGSMASAQTLAERDKFNQDKTQLALYAKRVNQACGTHIAFTIDYASYAGKSSTTVRMQSPTEYLMNAGDAIINICVTPAGKAAVAEKIHEATVPLAPLSPTPFRAECSPTRQASAAEAWRHRRSTLKPSCRQPPSRTSPPLRTEN